MADDAERRVRYQEELPTDLAKTRKLLESYSGIPPGEVETHLRVTREKAWSIFPYACIGRWRFLDFYITSLPRYIEVIQRLKSGDVFLDAGCCFGYVLRQLAFDGAPGANLIGTDLRPEFIDLGYDLFRDRDSFKGRFLAGNMLDINDQALASIDGKVDIIHAASFFHLFGWEDQVKLGARMIRFFKPDAKKALILGRQRADPEPLGHVEHDERELGRYHHNANTLQELWDEIGKNTGTRWSAQGVVSDENWGSDVKRPGLKFVITRLD